jgi:hypothetical protein
MERNVLPEITVLFCEGEALLGIAFVVHVMKVVVAVAVLMNVVLTHCEVWKGAEYEMEN